MTQSDSQEQWLSAHLRRIGIESSGSAILIPDISLQSAYIPGRSITLRGLKDQFRKHIESGQIIGEIGLDQWIELRHREANRCLSLSIRDCGRRNLPTSVHCLKAHEPLLETLRDCSIPKRGFKLMPTMVRLTPSPNFSTLALTFHSTPDCSGRRKTHSAIIAAAPEDRLLIETDAPDFLPINDLREFYLQGDELQLNHPANLTASYEAVTSLRDDKVGDLERAFENFERYFYSNGSKRDDVTFLGTNERDSLAALQPFQL